MMESRHTRFSQYQYSKKQKGRGSKTIATKKKRKSFFHQFDVGEYKVRKSLYEYELDELIQLGRFLSYERLFIFAKNVPFKGKKEEKEEYKYVLFYNLKKIFDNCEDLALTDDKLSGLYLYMDDYTLLVLEGAECMLSEICAQLLIVVEELWTENKVFLIENKIKERYFEKLYLRYIKPMNINEKFAHGTSNDVELMSKEHWNLKLKMHELCIKVGDEISVWLENEKERKSKYDHHKHSDYSVVRPDQSLLNAIQDQPLNTEEFNKLLPETQRIDLVLNSTRFYRNLEQHTIVYYQIPKEIDDEEDGWRVPYDYMLYNLFDPWTPFDVNRTFVEYSRHKTENNLDDETNEEKNIDNQDEDGEIKEEKSNVQ